MSVLLGELVVKLWLTDSLTVSETLTDPSGPTSELLQQSVVSRWPDQLLLTETLSRLTAQVNEQYLLVDSELVNSMSYLLGALTVRSRLTDHSQWSRRSLDGE